ncbi:MAG: hypothetical protein V3V12_00635 [Gammaproteobacteria bacterium]
MKKSEYHKTIDKYLKPILIELGFEEVELKGCMKEEVLYRKNRLWFGTSWDWRDRYLDVNLGRLYWFKDVMPRFIVVGNYSSYSNKVQGVPEKDENYLVKVANAIASTLPTAVTVYEERYEQIMSAQLNKRSKYMSVFLEHLGNEVKDEDLAEFKT